MEDQTNGTGDVPSTEGQITPQTFTIQGQSYSQQELESLVGLGKQTRDVETRYNTKLDRVYPEYTRLTQERSAWQAKEAEYRSQLDEFNRKQQLGNDTNADFQKAREAAKQLGIPLNEDLDKNYVKRADLDKYVDDKLSQREQVAKILSTADSLAKKYNGEDGRPRFNQKAVLSYAQATGEQDLEKAYKDMFDTELSSWEQSQVKGARSPGLRTTSQNSGAKTPARVKVTDANLHQLLQEAGEQDRNY